MLMTVLAVYPICQVVAMNCPAKCHCFSSTAIQCSNLNGPLLLPSEFVDISIKDSYLSDITNTSFSRNINQLLITETQIQQISSSAFMKLVNVTSIKFIGTEIKVIAARAFGDIRPDANITFQYTIISNIEPASFSRLYRIKLKFLNNVIKIIKSNALTDMQLDILKFYDTDVDVVQANAFSKDIEVGKLDLNNSNFRLIQHKAFKGFSKVQRTTIDKCFFTNISCNPLRDIHSATVAAGGTFSISRSVFICNCPTLAWMSYMQHNNLIQSDLICFRGEHRNSIINELEHLKEKCTKSDEPSCENRITNNQHVSFDPLITTSTTKTFTFNQVTVSELPENNISTVYTQSPVSTETPSTNTTSPKGNFLGSNDARNSSQAVSFRNVHLSRRNFLLSIYIFYLFFNFIL
jgi:predicted DNA binding protein